MMTTLSGIHYPMYLNLNLLKFAIHVMVNVKIKTVKNVMGMGKLNLKMITMLTTSSADRAMVVVRARVEIVDHPV